MFNKPPFSGKTIPEIREAATHAKLEFPASEDSKELLQLVR